MAKARMLHKKISLSMQVNNLPLPARLLFTWLISHADDEGKIKGDPKYVKATVVPMTNWSLKLIQNYLKTMEVSQLIYYWQENNEWFIQFNKWDEYQSIRKDRFEPSKLPSFNSQNDNQLSTKRQPDDNQTTAQANIGKYNVIEVNKSEVNVVKQKPVAVNNIGLVSPKTFQPTDDGQLAAIEVWRLLEPLNPFAFGTTYLQAYRNGLPAVVIRRFASEIRQSKCDKPGAVFNSKVKDYLNKKRG